MSTFTEQFPLACQAAGIAPNLVDEYRLRRRFNEQQRAMNGVALVGVYAMKQGRPHLRDANFLRGAILTLINTREFDIPPGATPSKSTYNQYKDHAHQLQQDIFNLTQELENKENELEEKADELEEKADELEEKENKLVDLDVELRGVKEELEQLTSENEELKDNLDESNVEAEQAKETAKIWRLKFLNERFKNRNLQKRLELLEGAYKTQDKDPDKKKRDDNDEEGLNKGTAALQIKD